MEVEPKFPREFLIVLSLKVLRSNSPQLKHEIRVRLNTARTEKTIERLFRTLKYMETCLLIRSIFFLVVMCVFR